MYAEEQLSRVEILQVEALKDEVHLCGLVECAEELIHVQLEDDQLVLCESTMQVPELMEVVVAEVNHFGKILYSNEPGQW